MRSINTRRHEKPEYRNHSHQQPKSPNSTILLKSNQTRWIRTDQQPQNLSLYEQYHRKLQIDTRKIERLPQYFRPPWTNIDRNRFDYELCAIRQGAFLTHSQRKERTSQHKINRRIEKRRKGLKAVVLSESTAKRKQFPQNSIYSAEQSVIINVTPLRITTKNE
jgi:hypothetical protein